MKKSKIIYFVSARDRQAQFHKEVIRIVQKLGYEIRFECIKDEISHKVDFDFFIADLEQGNTNLGYLISQALKNKKPVLGFYKQSKTRPILPSANHKLSIAPYVKENLEEVIKEFLEILPNQQIRFNFFIPSDIENYMDWRSFQYKQTKAEFLRGLIRDQIQKDKNYQGQLNNKK